MALAQIRRSTALALVLCAVAALVVRPAHAAGAPVPGQALPEYALTAWTDEDGLPRGDVTAIAQDLEGFLWVGTTAGLARFDGARFWPWTDAAAPALAQRAVNTLVGGRDGSLWIAFGLRGGIGRIKGGHLTVYGPAEGLELDSVMAIAEDRSGDVWAGGRGGLVRFRDGRWSRPPASEGFPGTDVQSLYDDREGQLWAGTAFGVYVRRHDHFEMVPGSQGYVQSFVEGASGAMWVTDNRSVVRRIDTGQVPRQAGDVLLPQASIDLARDSRGQIWVAALGGGLLRVRDSDRAPFIERVAYEHKLPSAPRVVFEDREGNVWVGMRANGLLRLAVSRVRTDIALDGLTNDGVRSLAVTPDGSVWVATGHSLNRFRNGRRDVFPVAQVQVLHVDPTGTLWASTLSYVARLTANGFERVPLPAVVRPEGILSLAGGRDGRLWLCSVSQGLMAWRRGALETFDDVPEVRNRACSATLVDSRGRTWSGFSGGNLAIFEDGKFRAVPTSGVAAGMVVSLFEDRRGDVWVSTRASVSRYRNDRVTTVTEANGPFEALVSPFVEDDSDQLWTGIKGGSAAIRVNPTEFDKVAAVPAYQVKYDEYDVADGFQGDVRYRGRAMAVKGPDGKIWMATGLGLAVIDPASEPARQPVVPPRIEQVRIDGRPVASPDLPTRSGTLTFAYSSLDLSAASKLRFRHRLEGLQDDWVVTGTQRTATFADLPPGRYRFRVSATSDGRWSESGVWEFSVAPPFYLTRQFLIVAVLALALLFTVGWWLRLRHVQGKYALVFAERARLSREIHDTLLQSLAAIGVELEAIASQIDAAQTAPREALRRLRRQTSHAVREARESIAELRSNALEPRSLCDLLRELAEGTTAVKHVQTDFVLTGRPVRCTAEVETQLLRIAQEAVANAVRHGRADRIEVALEFQANAVSLRVTDDGCGFSPGDRRSAAQAGEQLGLLSMRERGERIRARVAITSSPGYGTTIETTAPLAVE
jgi:signal transduction histidine kinase/ligand-binding sensor domain-containing protein